MNILFICKYNRFRSKIAEAVFNKYNRNKNNFARSAGLIRGSYPLDKTEVVVAKELNLELKGKPEGISTDSLKWGNYYILVADDVPAEIFEAEKYGKKMERWNISDLKVDSKERAKEIIIEIENKVKDFIKRLR